MVYQEDGDQRISLELSSPDVTVWMYYVNDKIKKKV